jgi:hypothetical protein
MCTGGLVTNKVRQRMVLQDPSLGSEWAAIEVRGYPVYPVGIEVGDQVDFDNVYVDEYRGVTTLQYYSASSHVVNSGGNPLPDPLPLPIWSLRHPAHPEDSERYASMLVTLSEPVTVGDLDLGPHEDNYSLLGFAGGVLWGSDYANADIDTTYYVSEGDCYARLTGIVQRYAFEAWDDYQLLPRGAADYVVCNMAIDDGPGPSDVRLLSVTPNPARWPATFRYELGSAGEVRLEVFDARGRRLAKLAEGPREAGRYSVVWGHDVQPDLTSGAYYVRLRIDGRPVVQGFRILR